MKLLDDLGDDAGTDRTTTFANRESNAFFHSYALALEVNLEFNVVARHAHFGTAEKRELTGDVCCAEVELRL